MTDTTARRPGDPDIPNYRWVPGTPDQHGSTAGCNGCAFRSFTATQIRCSRIPCQRHPGFVAELIARP